MSIRDRFKQKEQIVKEREANRLLQQVYSLTDMVIIGKGLGTIPLPPLVISQHFLFS